MPERLPAEPADLKSHDCVMLMPKEQRARLDLVSGRRKVRVHVSGPVASRDINSASAFVHRGHGTGLLPSTYCDEAIAKQTHPGAANGTSRRFPFSRVPESEILP